MNKIKMVRKEGGSRVISISKIIPIDWTVIELDVVKTLEDLVVVNIKKVK